MSSYHIDAIFKQLENLEYAKATLLVFACLCTNNKYYTKNFIIQFFLHEILHLPCSHVAVALVVPLAAVQLLGTVRDQTLILQLVADNMEKFHP